MSFKLFFIAVCVGVALSHPTSVENDAPKCQLPKPSHRPGLIQALLNGENPFSEFVSSLDLPDPYIFKKNLTATLKEKEISGTFSFYNGRVDGLSTIAADYDYSNNQFSASLTVKSIQLTGIYEIIQGRVDLPYVGNHKISGSGPVLAFVAGLNTSVSFVLQTASSTQHLSIGKFSLDFGFENVTVSVANLVVDGELVDWDVINSSFKPLYDALWTPAKAGIEQNIEKEVNKLLQGCTLMDLISWADESKTQLAA